MNESDQTARSESLLEEAHSDSAIPVMPTSSHERFSVTMDQNEKPSQSLPRKPVVPRGTRDGEWPQSPFHYQREDTLSQMQWSADADGNPGRQNYARAYEFHSSEIPGQQRCDMCEFEQKDRDVDDEVFDADIQRWITETRHQETVTIRLFVSYVKWTGHDPKLISSLTRGAFEAVEKDFELHPATIKTLLSWRDPVALDCAWSSQKQPICLADDTVWFISHFEPIANEDWAISIKYDRQKQCTDAMIFASRDGMWLVDEVVNELLDLHGSWNQSRAVLQSFLQVYLGETWSRIYFVNNSVQAVERSLGATRIWENGGTISDEWPQNTDVRENTASLHSALYRLSIYRSRLKKVKNSLQVLGAAESWSRTVNTATMRSPAGTRKLDEYSVWTDSLLQGTDDYLMAVHERAQIQADLLFSMISQKDSHEGISMAQSAFVFTFITALFLPCTVVASIFSMSMFDWQPDTESGSRVSNKFWIYWAFSLPLTIIVMGGWYWWSVKGMKLWNRSSSKDNKDAKGWRAKSRWVRFLGKRPKTQGSPIATSSHISTAASSSNRSSVSVRSRVSRAS